MIVFAFVMTIAVIRTQVAFNGIARNETVITKADRISCKFLNEDANVRARQTGNSDKAATAQKKFERQILNLERLFHGGAQTAQQRQLNRILVSYLRAQRAAVEASRAATVRNLVLARSLVKQGRALAAQLHC
jgi:hypothetical protein